MLVLASFEAAEACSSVPPEPFVVDEAEALLDTLPPAVPVVRSAAFVRARPPVLADDYEISCMIVTTSCDDFAWFEVDLESADDRTDPDDLGYRLVWLSGFPLPDHPLPNADGLVTLWFDDSPYDGPALEVRFQVVAVDRAGNESEPSEEVSVSSPATSFEAPPCGPSHATCGGAAGGGEVGMGVLVLPLLGRRRRR